MEDEPFDVYGDLEDFDLADQLKQKEIEVKDLTDKLNNLVANITQLQAENKDLTKDAKEMRRSMSSLLLTAKRERDRNLNTIASLRKEKDDIVFRRVKIGKKKMEAETQTDLSVGPNVFVDIDLKITELTSRLLLSAANTDAHTESNIVADSRKVRNPFSRTNQRDCYRDNRPHTGDRSRKHSNTENTNFYKNDGRECGDDLRDRINHKRNHSSERSSDDGRKAKKIRSTSRDKDDHLPGARKIYKRRYTIGQSTDFNSNERKDDFDRKTKIDRNNGDNSNRDVKIRRTSDGNVQIDVGNDLEKLYQHTSNSQIESILNERLQILRKDCETTVSVDNNKRPKRCDNEKPSVTITKVSKSTQEEGNNKNNDRQQKIENKSADCITLTKIDRSNDKKSAESSTKLSTEDPVNSKSETTHEPTAITIVTNSKENTSTQKPLNILLKEMEQQESEKNSQIHDDTEMDTVTEDGDKSKCESIASVPSNVIKGIGSNSKVSSSNSQTTDKKKSKTTDAAIVIKPKNNAPIEIPKANGRKITLPPTADIVITTNTFERKSNAKCTKKNNTKVIPKKQKNSSQCSNDSQMHNDTDDKKTKRQKTKTVHVEKMDVPSSTVSFVDNARNCAIEKPSTDIAPQKSKSVATSPIYDANAVKLAVASITETNPVKNSVSSTDSAQKPIEIVSDRQEVSVIPIDELESRVERVAAAIDHKNVIQSVTTLAKAKPMPVSIEKRCDNKGRVKTKAVKKPPKKDTQLSSSKNKTAKRKSGEVTPVKNLKKADLFKQIFGDSSPITKDDCPPSIFTDALSLRNNKSVVASSSIVEDANINGANQLLESSVPVDSATSFYQDFDISNVSSQIDPMSPLKVPSKSDAVDKQNHVDPVIPATTLNDTPANDSTSAIQALLQNSNIKSSPECLSTSTNDKQKFDRPVGNREESHCEDIDQIQEYLRETVSDAKTPMKQMHHQSGERTDKLSPQSQIDLKSDVTIANDHSSNVINQKPVISFENIFNREQITQIDEKLPTEPRPPPIVELSTSCMDIDVELTESLVHNSKMESEAINSLLNPLETPTKSIRAPTVDGLSVTTTINNIVAPDVITKMNLDISIKSTGSNNSPMKEQKCGQSTYYVEEVNEEVIIHVTRKRKRKN